MAIDLWKICRFIQHACMNMAARSFIVGLHENEAASIILLTYSLGYMLLHVALSFQHAVAIVLAVHTSQKSVDTTRGSYTTCSFIQIKTLRTIYFITYFNLPPKSRIFSIPCISYQVLITFKLFNETFVFDSTCINK